MHTLEQLIAFVAVYEHGSYSNAAKLLQKSRTTIREHIVTYEDLLGYPLFVIEGKKAVPTDRAKQLYFRAQLVEKQNRSLYLQSKTLYKEDIHTINICYDVITPASLICYVENQISNYNPNIIVNWLHRTRQEAMDLLLKGECDLATMPNMGQVYAEKEVTWQGIGAIKIGCYARVDSPLAKKTMLRLEDLMLETQYLTENFANLKVNFISTKVSPRLHIVSNNDLLCELVKYHGWTAMPKHYMQPWIKQGDLVELELNELSKDINFGLNVFYCHGKENIPIFKNILHWLTHSELTFL